jgi:hypothetical protein
MKSFKDYLEEKGRCWTGYKPVAGKKAFSPGSCVKEMAGGGGGAGGVAVPGPTNVTGPQSATDPVSATAVNMKKKKRFATLYRKAPK